MKPTRDSQPDFGSLSVLTTGRMPAAETGGTAVVLLHGWGAPDDDLVPLAQELAEPRSRFFLPAGPLDERGGGRAWWHLGPTDFDRPVHAWDDQPKAGHQPHRQVTAARAAVQQVLHAIKSRHQPDQLILGGFSQGAMLALDVALAAAPAVDRLVLLSGVLLEDSLPALRAQASPPLPILLAHGRHDELVPFAGGAKAKEILERHGHAVTWCPFNGGHEIPAAVVEEMRRFLYVRM